MNRCAEPGLTGPHLAAQLIRRTGDNPIDTSPLDIFSTFPPIFSLEFCHGMVTIGDAGA
jgi:hypothetical protein